MRKINVCFPVAAATATTYVIPLFDPCKIVGINVACAAAPGATATFAAKKVGGNNIFTGTMSATAKASTMMTPTATAADLAQICDSTSGIELAVTSTNANFISVEIMVDEYCITPR